MNRAKYWISGFFYINSIDCHFNNVWIAWGVVFLFWYEAGSFCMTTRSESSCSLIGSNHSSKIWSFAEQKFCVNAKFNEYSVYLWLCCSRWASARGWQRGTCFYTTFEQLIHFYFVLVSSEEGGLRSLALPLPHADISWPLPYTWMHGLH